MQLVRKSVVASAVAATAVALFAPAGAHAAAPTPGNLLIYRGGDGTAAQGSGTTSVWIDEYTTAGALVQSFQVPATGADALTTGSTTTTEGGLSVSLDNNWAVFTGYRYDAGNTSTPAGRTSDVAPRVVGRLNLATGAIDTDTALGTSFSASSIRGIAATDGTHFWTVGTSPGGNPNGGIVYTEGSGPAAVSTVIRSANQRGVGIFGGELYANNSGTTFTKITPNTSDAGAPGYATLPTIPGITNTTVLPGQVNVNGFLMYDLSPTVDGIDTIYFPSTDSGAGTSSLLKYTFDGGAWNPSGSANVPGVPSGSSLYNIAGKQNTDGSLAFFMTNTGTTGGTPNAAAASLLVTFTDTTGYGGALSGDATQLTSSAEFTSFRGIAIVPGSVAPPHFPGDTNNDGVVDLVDLNNVLNNFGAAGANPGDDNADGTVDLVDLNNVLNNFGATHAASALSVVPEPASLAACGLATLPLLARRRRRHAR